jgi:hypothetical protein
VLGSSDHAQKGSNSRHRTKSSRWSSEGFRLFQEKKGTKTEHQLSRWIPIRAGRCLLLCCTKLSSLQGDSAKRGGYPTKILGLCPDSRKGSDWLQMKLDLWVFRGNEARGRKNWGKKGAVRRYRKPEKPQENKIAEKKRVTQPRSKFYGCYINLMRVEVYLQTEAGGGGVRRFRHRES